MIPIENSNPSNYSKLPYSNISLVPNKILAKIDNVFSLDECKTLISESEKVGYKGASVYTDGSGKEHFQNDFRSSLRCIIDDPVFADTLEQRILHAIPKFYNGYRFHYINERFRFLKYDNAGHFERHTDGQYANQTSKSLITILIYLNDDYIGANTTFFPNSYSQNGFVLPPKSGMVCLMDQDISHEVPELVIGTKYVVRTELMYGK